MTVILIRLVFIYVFLTLTVRFMGKRQIGQMQMSELIVAIMLSELAAMPVTDTSVPLLYSILPILLLAVLEILTSFAFLHLPALSRMVAGTPQIVIRKGEIDHTVLKNCRMTLSELMGELRLNGIGNPADASYAILEENGRISVIPKSDKLPPRACDLSVQVKEEGICHILIADGVLRKAGMRMAGKNMDDIVGYLNNHGGADVSDIFLLTVDDAGNWNLTRKKKGG